MIKIENLTQAFGKKVVLDDVGLEIDTHEVCALVGRNGAGKSTLLNSLLGLLPFKKTKLVFNKTSTLLKRGVIKSYSVISNFFEDISNYFHHISNYF